MAPSIIMKPAIHKSALSASLGRDSCRWLAFVVLWIVSIGCTQNEGDAHSSLFEADHHVPAHWPSDLGDVASKLRTRLSG
jgi:hypothetical protein